MGEDVTVERREAWERISDMDVPDADRRARRVIEEIPISKVIGDLMPLYGDMGGRRDMYAKSVDRSFSGRCPFHEEKGQSFHVNDIRRCYKCFGCGASGNAIRFMMEFDMGRSEDEKSWDLDLLGLEMTWVEALEYLEEKYL